MRAIFIAVVLATVPLAAQGPNPPAQITASLSSATSLTLNVSGYASIGFQITGTWAGTITFEGSVDGATFQALNATPTNSSSAATTTTSNGVWTGSVGGLKQARARFSTYTSGTAVISIQAAASGGGSGGGGGGGSGPSGTIGAAVPSTAAPVAVKDNSGNLAYPTLDVSGNLLVAVTGAGSGGTSSVDGSGYTAGTTAGTPLMGARDDAGTTACAEDKNCIARVTSARALMVDASATTQPVSGTFFQATQPVSGTVTANAGTNLNTSLLALEAGGNLAAIKAKTDNIPALGQALAASSTPVVLTAAQITTLTPVTTITATQATGTNLHVVTDTTSTTAVTQATATNLNAAVVGTGTAGTPAGNILTVQGVASMTKLLVTPDSVALPANQSTNVAQLAGTTTDTNSGNKSAGTLRVVLATDQPALTNKLLVTPDSVALPANQSVNVAQINGVTPLMNAGATGTGAQRVNDVASSATGAAPPASALYVGGLGSGATGGFLVGAPFCDSQAPISMTSATTTLIVTGVSGRHVYICHLDLVTAIANNVAVITGTGATCGTSTAGVFGGTTAANGWNFAANGGIALGSGIGMVGRTETTGDSICIITSAAGPLAGSIVYAIY